MIFKKLFLGKKVLNHSDDYKIADDSQNWFMSLAQETLTTYLTDEKICVFINFQRA